MNTIPNSASSRALSLRKILPDATPIACQDISIHSCSGTWYDCRPGDLYVAVVEADDDGHDHVQQALENGATAVVTERLLAIDRPQFLVEDSRLAFGRICQALAGNPTDLIPAVGIAGADGKSITTQLIASILEVAGGNPCIFQRSSELSVGSPRSFGPDRPTRPAAIAQWLVDAVVNRASHALMEVPLPALATQQLSGMGFDVMVLTNIRRCESGEGVHTGTPLHKMQARALKFLKPDGVLVMNADDPKSAALLDEIETPTLTFGIHQAAELTGKILERTPTDLTFVMTAGSESVVVRSTMIGTHQLYNCLAAAAVGLAMGIELPTIARGLEMAGPLPGHLEVVGCGQEFNLYVDAARRPTPVATALHAVREHTQGKTWVLATVHDGQSPAERRRLGEVLEKAADQVVLAPSGNPQLLDYEPYHQVLDGFRKPGRARIIPNRFRAVEWLMQNCSAGDSVLILGMGAMPIAEMADGKWQVNDRDVCQAWLYDQTSFAATWEAAEEVFRIEDYRKKQR